MGQQTLSLWEPNPLWCSVYKHPAVWCDYQSYVGGLGVPGTGSIMDTCFKRKV